MTEFSLDVVDAADLERTWELDDMHMPFALAPLAIDYVETLCSGFNPAYARFGSPMRVYLRVFHGYCYMASDYGVPESEVPAMVGRLHDAYRDFEKDTLRYWNEESLPKLHRLYQEIAAIDVEGLSGVELAGAWDRAWAGAHEAWVIHFTVIRGPYRASEDLADLYEELVPGAPPSEAPRLIQGENDVLQAVEAGVERLALLAATRPAIAARLARRPLPSLDELGRLTDGQAFVDAVGPFLDEHGHLGQPNDDLTLPSWAEEPSMILAEIAKRIADAPEPGSERRARVQAANARLAGALRKRLADRPVDFARFEAQLAIAREIGPLTETHNYWIDRMLQASLRRLALRLAGRLLRDGLIAEVDDVFYLRRGEVTTLLLTPSDVRELIAHRRLEHDHQRTLTPPGVLGKKEPDQGLTSQSSPVLDAVAGDGVLKGTGASAGVVRGPARVALGPLDFDRIQRGDIIVCPSSNPSWVPLFSVAAGLVTNTGGVLSHAAVVAREFGLPAVVGIVGATTTIRDGQLLEIDGIAGTVRLL